MIRIFSALFIFIAITCSSMRMEAQLIEYEQLDTCKVYHSLEEAMLNPSIVYRLDLSKQKLKEFPKEIFLFLNLNDLKISRNKIIDVPDDIKKLRYLQRLDMQRNALDTITVAMCELRNLRQLNLSENFITGIPNEIEQMTELKYMILWQNPIEYYPNSLGMLEKLEVLDLLHNLINARTQDRLRNILPKTNIVMSPPCNCGMQEE